MLTIAAGVVIAIGYRMSDSVVACRSEMATIHAEMTTITDRFYLFPKEP